MKFAVFMYGHCREKYDSYIEAGAYMPCPRCSQQNPVIMASASVTGRCDKCGKPLESEGHEFWHDQFIACHNGGKK